MGVRDTLAKNIRARRKELGISQEKLAELCGMHRTYIGAIEQERVNVSIDNVEQIAIAMGVSTSSLFVEKPNLSSTKKENNELNHPLRGHEPTFELLEIEGNEVNTHSINAKDSDLAIRILCALVKDGYKGDELFSHFYEVQNELFDYFISKDKRL